MRGAAARTSPWAEAFGEVRGAGPGWLLDRRREAFARFEADGFPRAGDEEWRQTNVGPIAATAFAVTDGSPSLRAEGLPPGALLLPLSRALAERPELDALLQAHLGAVAPTARRPFAALNAAFAAEGALLVLPANVVAAHPVEIVHGSGETGEARHPRTLILAGAGSQATVVERFEGRPTAPALTNAVAEIVLGAGAVLHHVRVLDEGEGWHVGAVAAVQERDSQLHSHNVCLGAALARLDIGSRLAGTGAECVLNGLYLAEGHEHVDNHTTLEHASPHCPSRELYKGILWGSARAVFNGRIVVRPDAQKTDAKQSNRNLLLSGQATVYTRPQLEIYADDVKCTHGATIGQLDQEALFYLRARGIGEGEARSLLLRAFAAEILDRIPVPALRQELDRTVAERLHLPGRP
jgi:Fe-S cluster assembly protein SufD